MATGFVWHELFAWHDAGRYPSSAVSPVEPFPLSDTPDTKRRFRNLVEVSGLSAHLTALAPVLADDAAILRVHSPALLERMRRADATGGDVGPFARMDPGGLRIVRLAAGGVIAAVDAVLGGAVRNAYALVRPAGHHATPDEPMGYCLLNNVAIGARHAQAVHGVERVAVVDWDVHHGNGTEAVFLHDPSVLAISIHQDGLYPAGLGQVGHVGEGRGRGATINVPLPPGSGHGAYLAALDEVVGPALRRFRPGLILVGSGFDAHQNDPLGRMLLHSGSFRDMTARMMALADELCGGRLVFGHEGGYAPVHVPFSGLAVLEQLSGERTEIVDPVLANASVRPGQELQPHQAAVLASIVQTVLPLVPVHATPNSTKETTS